MKCLSSERIAVIQRSLAFDADGHLYLSTGDNSDPYDRTGSPMNEQPAFNTLTPSALRLIPTTLGVKSFASTLNQTAPIQFLMATCFQAIHYTARKFIRWVTAILFALRLTPKTGWLYWGDVGNGDAT